ncbi:MAG: TerC family protein [Sandaracinus sp.]|nr:TerC family protein [Sandaracinus sp.]MCB9619233.1 TerC family protein [Sandaracinus sp.]
MIEIFSHPDAWIALLTLLSLEVILGIDNIVFIAILTEKLPKEQQKLAYNLGLGAALVSRLALLFAISWVMHLTTPLFTIWDHGMTGRHLILLGGGLFLMGKAAHEIYEKVEVDEEEAMAARGRASLAGTVFQIMLLDIVFSLDSVITAVGMVDEIEIMVIAVVVAVGVMLLGARPIGNFVNRHPSMKILALSFLLLIGVLLTAEGFGQHISKGYIYFAMGFSVTIEVLNMRFRKKHRKVSNVGTTPTNA